MKLDDSIKDVLNGGEPKTRDSWRYDMFHSATRAKRGGKRHRPYTKAPLTGESKKRRKMAAKSRRINRR